MKSYEQTTEGTNRQKEGTNEIPIDSQHDFHYAHHRTRPNCRVASEVLLVPAEFPFEFVRRRDSSLVCVREPGKWTS